MRPDMAKVVTERPRAGLRLKAPKGYKKLLDKIPLDEQPHGEKIRQKWKGSLCCKNFTDVLGPIIGYLSSKVGQKWDDVYSEICQNLPKNSTNTLHVREHIEAYVERNIMMINGKPYSADTSFGGFRCLSEIFGPKQFYVDPNTGLLCKPRERSQRNYYKRPPKYIKVLAEKGNPYVQYHKIKGIWYLITLRDYKFTEADHYFTPVFKVRISVFASVYDLAYGERRCRQDIKDAYGGDYLPISKKQMNKKELAKAGLKNG